MTADIFNFNPSSQKGNTNPRNDYFTNIYTGFSVAQDAWIHLHLENPIEQRMFFNPSGFIMYDSHFYALNLQKGEGIRFMRTGKSFEICLGGCLEMKTYEVIHQVSKIETSPISRPQFSKLVR